VRRKTHHHRRSPRRSSSARGATMLPCAPSQSRRKRNGHRHRRSRSLRRNTLSLPRRPHNDPPRRPHPRQHLPPRRLPNRSNKWPQQPRPLPRPIRFPERKNPPRMPRMPLRPRVGKSLHHRPRLLHPHDQRLPPTSLANVTRLRVRTLLRQLSPRLRNRARRSAFPQHRPRNPHLLPSWQPEAPRTAAPTKRAPRRERHYRFRNGSR